MRAPARDPREPLFSLQMLGVSLLLGVSMLLTVFIAYWWAVERAFPPAGALVRLAASSSRQSFDDLRHPIARPHSARYPALPEPGAVVDCGRHFGRAWRCDLLPAGRRYLPLRAADARLRCPGGRCRHRRGVLWYEAYKFMSPRRRVLTYIMGCWPPVILHRVCEPRRCCR